MRGILLFVVGQIAQDEAFGGFGPTAGKHQVVLIDSFRRGVSVDCDAVDALAALQMVDDFGDVVFVGEVAAVYTHFIQAVEQLIGVGSHLHCALVGCFGGCGCCALVCCGFCRCAALAGIRSLVGIYGLCANAKDDARKEQ